jgi:hypothetical protein
MFAGKPGFAPTLAGRHRGTQTVAVLGVDGELLDERLLV